MLFLFTVLSFYRLIIFVKKQTLKNAIWYGVLTGLLMQSHFFTFFVLAAQVFILLYFLFQTEKKFRVFFFYQLLVSAGIIIIFFIPAIKLFIKTTQIKTFWIQHTTIETIKQIFKDFFFESNLLLLFTVLSIVILLFFLIRNKSSINEKKWIFTILLPWIILVLLIPVIRSYLSVPMIISRYFITILPPILLLTSLGIDLIKNRWIQISTIVLYLGFSIYFMVVEKQYYDVIAKTQFREITNHLKSNNNSNDEVVSLRGWYLNYFLKKSNTKIIDKSLESHVNEIALDTSNLKSFWYLGAFGDNYNLNANEEEFINKHYLISNEKTLFDCWTKHYVLKKSTNEKPNTENKSIQLTNISDQNWYSGVGKFSNMLLLDYSVENLNLIKSCKSIKFKDNMTISVIGYEKTGAFIHLFLNTKAIMFKEVAAFPNKIELIQ
jgi:mannosyltransferase